MATARQPKWIAMLALALLLATVFVVLSVWQFGVSRSEGNPVQDITEEPVQLTEIYEPERSMSIYEADRIVDLSGEFLPETEVLIDERLREEESGYWLVAAFRVDGAPDDEVIPVVLGWTQDAEARDAVSDLTGQDLQIRGRLLPPEAPGVGPYELPAGVLPTLSSAELINLWDVPSYSGFVVSFEMTDASGAEVGAPAIEGLEPVWVDPQPEPGAINWLNLFYAVEWIVFAGFAFYLWWRLVKDAHLKELEEEERLDREWEEQWKHEQLAKRRAEQAANGTKDSDD
ncbi:hypothetical protein GCM10009771_08080 [Nesterenkonia flava]